jgi:hypothetical protein
MGLFYRNSNEVTVMSIETAEGMENSEFALSEEEKAELEAQEKLENEQSQDEEVDQEFLDKLLNGEGGEGSDGAPSGGDGGEGGQEGQQPNPDEDTANQGGDGQGDNGGNQQQEEDDTAYQQHLANEEARNAWQEKLEGATEAKQTLLDELKAIGTKFDDGEIGQGQYDAEKERLKDLIKTQDKLIGRAETSLEQAEQTYQDFAAKQQEAATQAWYNELQSFVTSNPAYDPKASDNRYGIRFDEILHDLNAKQAFAGLNQKQIIQTVQQRVEMELGAPKQAPAPKQQEKKLPKREDVKIPPTMTQMTAAETNDLGDEFAMLDRLQGLEYEEALEKLELKNPEAFKRYLNNT